ncbi:MFS transporter [Rhodoferax sp. GW822-FHT02A01]|uniref:MFS transporter n=1 Tax=Rhodoferax sp. GW822-FHT02A01 TaxID=3141537 RepID=UPI00315CD17C
MGFPLAFVALPLYVVLPHHYATTLHVPLAALGALMLGARLLDAVIDPLLGRWSDHLYAQSNPLVLRWGGVAALALALGFALLFFPPVNTPTALLVWAGLALLLTYTAFSALSILHQSWGARLGGDETQRSRIVAWREGWGLLGVVLASVAPFTLGMEATTVLFALALAGGWWAWRQAVQPPSVARVHAVRAPEPLWLPFSRPAFRALLAVFMANGIASAVPATLILFFVQDRLQAPAHLQPFFLGSYFLCAALSMPLWLCLVPRLGLARTWGLGMLMAIAVFAFAAQLGAGDSAAFMVVCALSGVALGTDLALPAALLAGTIAASGDRGQAEGAYFGWWNFATKLNLALAAGVALPLLGLSGYTPGAQDATALRTLTFAYCLVPCALKLLAATLLYNLIIRKPPCNDAS